MKRRAFVAAVAMFSTLAVGCSTLRKSEQQSFVPDAALTGQLYEAIWFDIHSNALIGNGNVQLAGWANAASRQKSPQKLHIQNLSCRGGELVLSCDYYLFRDGGIVEYMGSPTPDRLSCSNDFRRDDIKSEWAIPRLAPRPNGGHSRITIECQPID